MNFRQYSGAFTFTEKLQPSVIYRFIAPFSPIYPSSVSKSFLKLPNLFSFAIPYQIFHHLQFSAVLVVVVTVVSSSILHCYLLQWCIKIGINKKKIIRDRLLIQVAFQWRKLPQELCVCVESPSNSEKRNTRDKIIRRQS